MMRLVIRLLAAVPRGRQRFGLALGLAIAATGASVALLGVSAWLLSFAAEHPAVAALTVPATAVRAFGTSRGVLRYAERLYGHDLALRMQGALRFQVYEKLARTTTLGAGQGDLLTRVTADVAAIMDVVVRVALPFASASVVLLGTSLILATYNAASAVSLLGCAVIAGIVVPGFAARLSQRHDAATATLRSDMADVVYETAQAAPDLVAYQAVEPQFAKLAAADARLRHADQQAAWIRGLAAGVQSLVMGVAVAAALLFGAQAVAAGALSTPALAVLVLTPLALYESFDDLTKAAQTVTRARAALGRVTALLDAAPLGVGDRSPSVSASSPVEDAAKNPAALLVIQELAIGWPGSATLLTGLNLELRAGERVAVVGASGVGKTTLAATILGLIPAVAGELRTPAAIGYLAQDAHIFTTTVAENVRIGNPNADPAAVAAALARVGLAYLDPNREVSAQTLSGGEARRVAAARLLVMEPAPELVILDEPTEHLAPELAAALLRDLWGAFGSRTALLVITHDAAVVSQCAATLRLS